MDTNKAFDETQTFDVFYFKEFIIAYITQTPSISDIYFSWYRIRVKNFSPPKKMIVRKSLVVSASIITVIVPTVFFCKLFQSTTLNLFKLGSGFYESAWYELPILEQKLFLLPMKRAQWEVRVRGLYIIYCSRYRTLNRQNGF